MSYILTKSQKGILIMLLSALLVSVGQLFWKLSNTAGYLYLMMGFLFYIISSLLMIKAYHYGELHILQPILSIGYVLSLVFGITILNEDVSSIDIFGVVLIILGVLLIITGAKK